MIFPSPYGIMLPSVKITGPKKFLVFYTPCAFRIVFDYESYTNLNSLRIQAQEYNFWSNVSITRQMFVPPCSYYAFAYKRILSVINIYIYTQCLCYIFFFTSSTAFEE